MAIDVLLAEITHEARHDLEAFYWLLVFVILRHTNHGHERGKAAFGDLFCHESWGTCASKKLLWIQRAAAPLTVPGNEPLNTLLENFRSALRFNVSHLRVSKKGITHREVIRMFDKALASKNWPTDDAALPWVPPADLSRTKEMEATLNTLRSKGTIDLNTGTHRVWPSIEPEAVQEAADESSYMQDFADDSDDSAHNNAAAGPAPREPDDHPMDEEAAFWRGRSARPGDVPFVQPQAGPSTLRLPIAVSPLPISGSPLFIAESPLPVPEPTQSIDDPPCTIHKSPLPTLGVPTRAPEATHEHPRLRTRAQSSRQVELPQRQTRSTARKAGIYRKAAETWPADKAEGAGAESHRYNLRSSSRRGATSDDVQPAIANQRVTRSRAKESMQARTVGTAGSSVGKRSRIDEDFDGLEEGMGSQTSKRQRTLSQSRGSKTSKRSADKP